MLNRFSIVALLLVSGLASASSVSPYAGQQVQPIKALSPEQVADYLDGRGMGYAKAAELNHYPGPRHVLDMDDGLMLTPQQRQQTQALFESMRQQAVALGEQLVEKERLLDQKFATSDIDAESLRSLLSEIGALEARLRYVHLQAHLEQKAMLSQHQVHLYDQLRGYTGDGRMHGNHSHHH